MSDSLKDVGNPIKLNTSADPNYRITDKLRTFMSKIDLVPVKFKLTIPTDAFTPGSTATVSKAVKYDFELGIKQYRDNIKQYVTDTSFSGVRIWSTTDGQFQEDISNTFETNILEDKFNSAIDSTNSIRSMVKSLGGDLTSFSGSMGNMPGMGGMKSNGVNGVIDAMLEGKHMSLPKIWKSSNYSPTLNVNVRLVSPYGDSKAIRIHVVEPLVYLLGLCSPTSKDGVTYGNVGYVRVNAYGLSNINLGYIENISIVRGGSDMTFNQYSQPLFVDLNITIKSAFDGFGLVEDEGVQVTDVDSKTSSDQDGSIQSGIASVGTLIKSFYRQGNFEVIPTSNHTTIGNQLAGAIDKLSASSNAANSMLAVK